MKRPVLLCLLACAVVVRPAPAVAQGEADRAGDLYRAASRRLREGRLISRSLTQLQEASRLAPEDPRILETLACAYVSRALELVRLTTPEGQALAAARENREIVRGGQPITAYTGPLMDLARQALDRALDIARVWPEARHTLGWTWLVDLRQGLSARREEASERALESLTAAVRGAPNVARYHQSLGDYYRALAELGQSIPEGGDPGPAIEAARAHYESALRLEPRNPGLHLLLYTLSLAAAQPDMERAQRHLVAAARQDPGNALYPYLEAGLLLERASADAELRAAHTAGAFNAILAGNRAARLELSVYQPSAPACMAPSLAGLAAAGGIDSALTERLEDAAQAALRAAQAWAAEDDPRTLEAFTVLVAMGERLTQNALTAPGAPRLAQASRALALQREALAPLTQWALLYGSPLQITLVRQKQQELALLSGWMESAILESLPEDALSEEPSAEEVEESSAVEAEEPNDTPGAAP